MWTLRLQVVFIAVFLQVPGGFPSCLIVSSVANCGSQNLVWVPPLPPHITHLYLELNRIREINSTSLSGLEDLQELDLGGQRVRLVIRDNAFRGQRRLRRLVLGFNVGLQLDPRAFVGLSGLQSLYLDYCSLQDSILQDDYLEPLSSLETLDLFGNHIRRLRPAKFFANMTDLTVLNLKLNNIERICESDLVGFHGKNFKLLNLDSVHLPLMSERHFDWETCGNPFRGMSFQTLDLSSIGFNAGHYKQLFTAIRGTKISQIKLSGHMGKGFSFNNVPDPDRTLFQGLNDSSVHTLDLSKNRIFALQQGFFSALKEVVIIDVSRNNVNQIHRNAFAGLQGHLETLNLSHNLLGEIHSYTFASLTNLRVLDLSYNHIGVLGVGSFGGLPQLKALHLTGNSLRSLGVPASVPSLDRLLLDDNKLSSVSRLTTFAPNITHLDIQGNRLTVLGDVFLLDHLQHLSHGGNPVRWCSLGGQLPNVQILDLHSSSLQSMWSRGRCLDLFDGLGHVKRLNVSSNALTSLPLGVFRGLTSVVDMDLSSNQLTYLQPDVLPRSLKVLNLSNNFLASPDPPVFRHLSALDLRGNRFHCGSDLQVFLTWLTETDVVLLSPADELTCDFPSDFYNVPLVRFAETSRGLKDNGRLSGGHLETTRN
ncbi:toll-like receptor 5 [Etheostoma cragini]|uniref:toll-like receptor 5 n=1 Tax=Etheostoma cragini TaxID=417921 RepID=UPI00155DE44D|nr:toll-like receptor 5 [Etheostoma cragini]